MFTAIPTRQYYGYTCKIWLAYQLEKEHLGENYYVWFAKELNPIENGDSSNPLELYAMMDRAVKKRDLNHPKLKDLKAGLLNIIKRLVAPKDPDLARALKSEVTRAPAELFRPQIWRIDLSKIAASRIRTDRTTAGWDEQYIPDLVDSEFEIIVE